MGTRGRASRRLLRAATPATRATGQGGGMVDRLVQEEARLRTALRGRRYSEGLAICERLVHSLRITIAGARGGNGPKAAPRQALTKTDVVPASVIAHELGIDRRTFLTHTEGEDFVSHPAPRVWLIDRPRFTAWHE